MKPNRNVENILGLLALCLCIPLLLGYSKCVAYDEPWPCSPPHQEPQWPDCVGNDCIDGGSHCSYETEGLDTGIKECSGFSDEITCHQVSQTRQGDTCGGETVQGAIIFGYCDSTILTPCNS